MKASDIKIKNKPPRVLKLPVSAFVEVWTRRPTAPLEVGLRRLSAGEQEFAAKEAANKADELLPRLTHADPVWIDAYDIILLHMTVSFSLTRPDDVQTPLWPQSDGSTWVSLETSEGLSAVRNPSGKIVSTRFTKEGMGRLYDELSLLSITDNPLWEPLDDTDIRDLGMDLLKGDFLRPLEAKPQPDETDEYFSARRAAADQIRRLLGYIIEIREELVTRPPVPPQASKDAKR